MGDRSDEGPGFNGPAPFASAEQCIVIQLRNISGRRKPYINQIPCAKTFSIFAPNAMFCNKKRKGSSQTAPFPSSMDVCTPDTMEYRIYSYAKSDKAER